MQGLIFIPDITGFTNFVNQVNNDHGVFVITALLNEIIISNPLDVELNEIEGDALLYYKIGDPIPINKIFAGFKKITQAFDTKYKSLKTQYNTNADLSLKFIVHYGNIKLYEIKGFRQLYGETVIESHRLLKNGLRESNYILITEDYLTALNPNTSDVMRNNEFTCNYFTFDTGSRKIGLTFINFPVIKYVKMHCCLLNPYEYLEINKYVRRSR